MTRILKASERKGKAAKLTADDVRRARTMAAQGTLKVREFAHFCGVGAETLRRAVRGETWTEVSFEELPSDEALREAAASSQERMIKAMQMERERLTAADKMVEELETAPVNPTYPWLKQTKGLLDE